MQNERTSSREALMALLLRPSRRRQILRCLCSHAFELAQRVFHQTLGVRCGRTHPEVVLWSVIITHTAFLHDHGRSSATRETSAAAGNTGRERSQNADQEVVRLHEHIRRTVARVGDQVLHLRGKGR